MLKRAKVWWIKVTNWEFWPFSVLYFPVFFFYAALAVRYRSFFFFTSANPGIDFGGMLGESKSDIFKLIPQRYLPAYRLIAPGALNEAIHAANQLTYPLVAKPDIGERGNLVEKISSENELVNYVQKCPVPFLLQEFVDLPIELGLFFIKHPGHTSGKVTSIVQKDFLHVIGTGHDTVRQLLTAQSRALLLVDFDHPRFQNLLSSVPEAGERITVEGIGNHCRGTTFLNAEEHISPKLHEAFSKLSEQIDGFYFGRFDLRCKTFEELENLENFKIMELNGAGSEPGHIYQPGYPLWRGYAAIFRHLAALGKVSHANYRLGVDYWPFKAGLNKMRQIKAYNKIAQES